MRNRKYSTVIAAVLAGAILFSPLVCGMSCLEARVRRASAGAELVQPAEELMAEIPVSAVVGCVWTRVVSEIDFIGWAERVDVECLVRVGVEALRVSDGLWRGEVFWR